ncbi:MAG: hypothetical protein ACREB8_13785, partial [Pseudolabrys sp.]
VGVFAATSNGPLSRREAGSNAHLFRHGKSWQFRVSVFCLGPLDLLPEMMHVAGHADFPFSISLNGNKAHAILCKAGIEPAPSVKLRSLRKHDRDGATVGRRLRPASGRRRSEPSATSAGFAEYFPNAELRQGRPTTGKRQRLTVRP